MMTEYAHGKTGIVNQDAVCFGKFSCGANDIGSVQSGGEIADGVVAWAKDCDAPARSCFQHEAALERGDQAGPDQRRFPGA